MSGTFSFLETGLDLTLELEFVRLYINGQITYMEKGGIPGDSANYEGLRTVQLCYRWRMVKNRI